MKKKDVKAKIQNALNLILFELQVSPSKKIKKSISEFSQEFSVRLKDDWKKQLVEEKEKTKVKKVKNA
jgi:hypothetical protein